MAMYAFAPTVVWLLICRPTVARRRAALFVAAARGRRTAVARAQRAQRLGIAAPAASLRVEHLHSTFRRLLPRVAAPIDRLAPFLQRPVVLAAMVADHLRRARSGRGHRDVALAGQPHVVARDRSRLSVACSRSPATACSSPSRATACRSCPVLAITAAALIVWISRGACSQRSRHCSPLAAIAHRSVAAARHRRQRRRSRCRPRCCVRSRPIPSGRRSPTVTSRPRTPTTGWPIDWSSRTAATCW